MRRPLIAPAAALIAAVSLTLGGCGGPPGGEPTAAADSGATEDPGPASSPSSPVPTPEPLTLADIDAAGIEALGYVQNPDTGSDAVGLWQTSECTVQILVQTVRVTGDDRKDSERAFAELPDRYAALSAHPDVTIPLQAGGTLESPAMAAELTHADGTVTPAVVTMRVIGSRTSLLSITEWCWDHAVTEADVAATLAALSLGGEITAP